MLAHGQVAVTTSPQRLSSDSGIQVETLLIKGLSTNGIDVFIGVPAVTPTTGYPISAGEEFIITPAHENFKRTPKPYDVWVVATSAGASVAWMGTRK